MRGEKRCGNRCKNCSCGCKEKKGLIKSFNKKTENGSDMKDVDKLCEYLEQRFTPRTLISKVREHYSHPYYEDCADWELVANYLFNVSDALGLNIKSDDIDNIAETIVYERKFGMSKSEVYYVKVF